MSTLVVSNISDGATTVGASYIVDGTPKAYVHAESDATIYDSINISSGTDHSTGDYSYATTNSFTGTRDYTQTNTCRTTAVDRIASRNPSRDLGNVIAVETGDGATNANTDNEHNVIVVGRLA